ncbi:MFS transporter [bacterium]|nr:MFS transporter [bacterium]
MPELDRTQRSRRNTALAIVVFAFVLSSFQRYAPAGIAQDLAASFGTTASSLGVLAATFFYVYTLMQLPTGIIVDIFGPSRILLLGGIISSAGSLLFGMAASLEMALIGRMLIGLGVSVTFITMLKFIALWFDESRFASLVGLCLLVGNLGSALAGSPLSWLAQVAGWRSIFVALAIVSLFMGIACWLLVSDQPQRSAEGVIQKPRFDRTVAIVSLLQVIRNRATWPAVWINVGVCGSFVTFGGLWATPFLTQVHGMSRAVAASHVSLYFICFALGCLFIGSFSDRLGKRKSILLMATHLNALIWGVWLSGLALPLVISYVVFALMGLLASSFSLTWACAKEVNPPKLSGMSTSFTNFGGFLAGAILQPLFGWTMDLNWAGGMSSSGARLYTAGDYHGGILLLAGMSAIGAVASWSLRETNCRNIWKPVVGG